MHEDTREVVHNRTMSAHSCIFCVDEEDVCRTSSIKFATVDTSLSPTGELIGGGSGVW